MKQYFRKITAFGMAAALSGMLFAGCAKEALPVPDQSTGTMEEMVSYLQAKGVIKADTEPVDINVTDGYMIDNSEGVVVETAVADKALDYDGLWIYWWDPEEENEYDAIFDGIFETGGKIELFYGLKEQTMSLMYGNFGFVFAEGYENGNAVIDALFPTNKK